MYLRTFANGILNQTSTFSCTALGGTIGGRIWPRRSHTDVPLRASRRICATLQPHGGRVHDPHFGAQEPGGYVWHQRRRHRGPASVGGGESNREQRLVGRFQLSLLPEDSGGDIAGGVRHRK